MAAVEQRGGWVGLYDHHGWFVRMERVEEVEEWAPWRFRGIEFSGVTAGVTRGMVLEQRGRWGLGVVGWRYGRVKMKPGVGVWLDDRVVAFAPIPTTWRRFHRAATIMQMGGEE